MVIAYGFDDGQSEAVAFYPFRRTVEAAENQFLVQGGFVGCVHHDQLFAGQDYAYFPFSLLWRTAFTMRLFIMLSNRVRLAFTDRGLAGKSLFRTSPSDRHSR